MGDNIYSEKSFDENLRERKVRSLQASSKKHNSEIVNQRKNEILQIIITYFISQKGINQQKLLRLVTINDRKYLAKLLRELVSEGIIKKVGGKRGLYIPKDDFYVDPLLDAELFGEDFISKILEPGKYKVLNEDKKSGLLDTKISYDEYGQEFKNLYDVDFTLYKRYYEPTFGSNDELEKNIFEFSNMIGAFVTYSIIQSINGDNYRNKKEVLQQALIESIRQYMIKSVGNIVPYLVPKFLGYIQNSFPDLQKNKNNSLLLNEDKVRAILNSFCWLYPLLSYNFEKSRGQPYVFNKVIFDTNESSIEYYKQKKSILYKELKAQEVCRHKFGYAKYSELTKSYTKKCSKCGQVKRVLR
jgi:hypothetical protein